MHDYAVVYLGHKVIQVLDRTKLKAHNFQITKDMTHENGARLWIIVEASGHINFDRNMLTDKKGLYSIKGLDKEQVWVMWKYPLNFETFANWKVADTQEQENKWGETFPKLYQGQFDLQAVGDTYLDVAEYGKGYIWVNGHNLGRYW